MRNLATALAFSSLMAGSACADQTWTQELPITTCVPLAPANACLTTQPLDLRGVTRFRLSVQGTNFAAGQSASTAEIRLRDTMDMASPCFGTVCPTLQIPYGSPPLGSFVRPSFTSAEIAVPPDQRRADVRLRLDFVNADAFQYANARPPLVQFYRR